MNHSNRWLASVVLLALVLLAGCGSPASRSGAGNGNNATQGSAAPPASGGSPGGASPAPPPADANALEGLTKSVTALLSARSFRARMDASMQGREIASTVEFVAPDRFRMTSENDETIIVGSNAWIRQNNGAWQKLPIDASRMIASVRDPKAIEELRKNAEVRLVGPDTLDGKPMTVYEYTRRNVMGTEANSRAKAWISAADNLPHRMETETDLKGMTSKATITYFDYNADIKIDPPK